MKLLNTENKRPGVKVKPMLNTNHYPSLDRAVRPRRHAVMIQIIFIRLILVVLILNNGDASYSHSFVFRSELGVIKLQSVHV